MNNTNMTVKNLKDILAILPDDMKVIVPIITVDDANDILAFRFVRTAGILECPSEKEQYVLCLNAAADGVDIKTQVDTLVKKCDKEVTCSKVLF